MKLLEFAKEEIALKKRALEIMEESGKKHEQTMQTFSESISGMTNVISSGFILIQGKDLFNNHYNCHSKSQHVLINTKGWKQGIQ